MTLFLFLGSRRGYAVLNKLIAARAKIAGILCLVEDAHEEAFHPRVAKIAKTHDIPFFHSNDVKPAEYADLIRQINPDIAFAVGWRYLIPAEAYQLPPKGTLILHDSLLPKYRGFAPMNWAIINGEKQTGVTLFYIADGVDSGPIVDQRKTDILLTDTAATVDEKIIRLYEDILTHNLDALAAGTASCKPQAEEEATYTCKRIPRDGEINWQASAEQIHNLIRGLTHPFPGAYTQLNGRQLFIWGAELPEKQVFYTGNIPGRVLGKKDGHIEVLTGKGVIRLSQLQFANEPEKNAAEIAMSVKDTMGW